MNILYLSTHVNVGGITSYLMTLARGFRSRGHGVYVASSGGECVLNFTSSGIIHVPIPIKTKSELNIVKLGLSLNTLAGSFGKGRIDVIHSNTRVTQVLGCVLQKMIGGVHITTCHGFFKNRFSRRLFPCWGDSVIAISDSVKEHLIFDLKVSGAKVNLVYNGIDVVSFSEARKIHPEDRIKERAGLGLGGGPVIGIIARLSDVKGHKYLIQAMKLVVRRFPDAALLVVGEGPMERKLTALVNSLDLEKNVVFRSNVAGTMKILPLIDIYASPSLNEGLGLSLMEAMAAGLPCVGSAVGGIKNLINCGDNGLLVKPADPAGLAAAIESLISDREKARALGERAQMFINRNFSQTEMLLRTEEVYRQCLARRN